MLELLWPIYVLCNAGDYSAITLEKHITNKLGMQMIARDPVLFAKFENSAMFAINAIAENDCLNGSSRAFEHPTQNLWRNLIRNQDYKILLVSLKQNFKPIFPQNSA